MKKNQHLPNRIQFGFKKLLLIMKLSALFSFISVMAVASVSYSQEARFNLAIKNANIIQIFDEIERLTEYGFLFQTDQLDVTKVYSLDLKDVRIENVLNRIIDPEIYSYQIIDRNIVIRKTDETKLQDKKMSRITGRVTDLSGNTLPGVSVVVKGTTNGTITDGNGLYALFTVPAEAVLQFSFVGMKTLEILVEGRTTVNAELQEETYGIEEVVAIGYGSTTKPKMVAAISTVKTDEISESPYTNVISGIAGRVSGVIIQNSGGEYGSSPAVRIRGAVKDPLYVIDGIYSSKSEFAQIPASDIESISILKDASAIAVYGFNAGDGVVLVTTKKGKEGAIRLSYKGTYAVQRPTLLPNYITPYRWALIKNEAAFRDGTDPIVDDETLNILKNNLDPQRYPVLNPFDMAIHKFAPQQEHNLTLSGRKENTTMFLSANYYQQDGIYKTNNHGLKRYSIRSNVGHEFTNIGLKIDGNINLQRFVKTSPPFSTWTIWSHIRNWQIGKPMFNPDGNYTGEENPLAEADTRAGYRNEEENTVVSQLTLEWAVPKVKGLTLKGVGYFKYQSNFNKNWNANLKYSAPIYLWDNTPVTMGAPNLYEYFWRGYNYNLEGHVNYIRTFADKHNLELTYVYTQSEDRGDFFWASRKDYVSPAVDQLFAGSSEGKDNSGGAGEGGRSGMVARVKYDYDGKYILEANGRYDGYDGFSKEQRTKFFPSVSLGWNLHKEKFMESLLASARMNSLKLRASWGKLGRLGENDSEIAANRFSYLAKYNLLNNVYYTDGKFRTGFTEGNLTPTQGTTTWYSLESRNIGVDFDFWKSKLSGTFDYFYYRTTGYLGSPADRYTTPLGKSLPRINTNSALRRAGLEASLNYKTNISDVKLEFNMNATLYDQLWERKFDEDSTTLKNPYKRTTHQTDYYGVGYRNNGFYQNIEEVINNPRRLGSTQTTPGDIRYQDFNGDGRIDADDQVRIGKSGFPHLTYGFSLSGEYKGWKMDALFQGSGKYNFSLGGIWISEPLKMLYTVQDDTWSENNRDALFPRASNLSGVNGNNNYVGTDFWLKDMWYLRMKSLTLSYNLKTSFLKSVRQLSEARILLSAVNLFTISPATKYYLDPETSNTDNYGYPVAKTYSIGLNVKF
ncbi:MAG: TonB-dependent receptor [Mangrovibacterium sp.]